MHIPFARLRARRFALAALLLFGWASGAAAIEIVIDNTDPQAGPVSGIWWTPSGGSGYEGVDHVTAENNSGSEFRWTPELTGIEAQYDVYVKYASSWWNLGTDAPYTVAHMNGSTVIDVDQTQNGGQWVYLGRFPMVEGSYIALGDQLSANKRPSADAVRLVTAGALPPPSPECGDPMVAGPVDPGVYVWRDCGYDGPGLRWFVTLGGGGYPWSGHTGIIGSESVISAEGNRLEPSDTLDTVPGDYEVDFTLFVRGTGVDEFMIDVPENGITCFAPIYFFTGQTYFMGADRTAIRGNFDMRTLEPCTLPDPGPPVEEIIVDNSDPEAGVVSGVWWNVSGAAGYEGANFTTSANNSGGEFRWTPNLSGLSGEYDVYVKYATSWVHLGTDVPYTVVHDRGIEEHVVDQTVGGGEWVRLGRYFMSSGSYISIRDSLSGDKRPSADAVRLVRVGGPPAERRNFVVILTDDQRWDSIDEMPILLSRIADRGVRFENAFVSTPLCGAVRANLISGGFRSYNTGILSNPGVNGGEVMFREQDSDTIATALQQVGYKTMFAGGKYLNGYRPPYIPPGWTQFVNNRLGPCCSGWFDFEAIVGSSGTEPGSGVTEVVSSTYVTDYHRDKVLDFLDEYGDSDFFVFFSVFQPHAPAIPDTQDLGLFPGFEYSDRAVGETDLSDKPDWVANPNRILSIKVEEEPDMAGKQLRSLQAVDRAVGAIVDKIEALGELDNTVFIYTSDNGYLWGEHGLHTKGMAYDESIRVPFVVAAPGVAPGSTNDNMVMADLDIGPTVLSMAGLTKPSDGVSIEATLADASSPLRAESYFQHWGYQEGAFGTWSAIRTDQWKYIENAYGERELYDLIVDPYEEESLHDDPSFDVIEAQLATQLAANRGLSLRTFNAPQGRVGNAYSYQLTTWGGQPPLVFYVVNGSLPNGITLNNDTGEISGTPTTAGEYYAEIAVEDSAAQAHTGLPRRMIGTYTIVVNP